MFGAKEFQETWNVSRETLHKLKVYEELLKKWQNKINLVGPSTVDDIWLRHFSDSAQLVPLVLTAKGQKPFENNLKWLDLGAGAGFPGIVVALLGGGEVHLVESNGKKCTFMRQVIRETGANAHVHQCRIEDMPSFGADIITSRALATVELLLGYSGKFVTKNTEIWLLKGQDVDEELTLATISRNIPTERFKSKTDSHGSIIRIKADDVGDMGND